MASLRNAELFLFNQAREKQGLNSADLVCEE